MGGRERGRKGGGRGEKEREGGERGEVYGERITNMGGMKPKLMQPLMPPPGQPPTCLFL